MSEQKVAIICGASRTNGLGLNIARELRQHGYQVVATCRLPETGRDLIALAEADAGVTAVPLDVCQQGSVDNLAKLVRDGLGRCDLVVYCCGIPALREPLYAARIDEVAEQIQVHALGLLRVAQAFLPLMEKGGLIVNVSSVLGSLSGMGAGYAGYAPAKAASNALARQLACCLRSRGISVVSVHPGVFASRIGGPGGSESAAAAAHTLARRILTLGLEHSGSFLDAATGRLIPW